MNKIKNLELQKLRAEALSLCLKMESVIDKLKNVESAENLEVLPKLEDYLGQLSSRAHVFGSDFKYIRVAEVNK